MKMFNKTLVAMSMLTSGFAFASTTAITNATIHTANDQGVLTQATVVIENGKIVAINPTTIEADILIDAKNKILTPGLIGSMNQLGLIEVGAVASSRDASYKKADITFDPSLAFNPKSSLIPYARKGGISKNLIVPDAGDSIFAGLASIVNLTGHFDSVESNRMAVVVELGAKSKGSRAHSLQTLINKLSEQQKKNEKLANKKSDNKDADKAEKEPSKSQQLLTALLNAELPLIVNASRAQDILELIKLKQKFSLDLIIADAQDAVAVKTQLAEANVPVLINSMDNLPGNFDSLHASLNNAGVLAQAGVTVGLMASDPHNLYQLRFDAGNAIANGMDSEAALKAVTSNLAKIFRLETGEVAVGKDADLVLWSADPFEISSRVESIWINGEKLTTDARQDKLRERYMKKSDMPTAYTQ